MTANPIELIGGLATGDDVSKADLIAWAKARVPQVFSDVTEVRNTILAGQMVIGLKSSGATYIQDTTDTTTIDDGLACLISLDGRRFKIVSSVPPSDQPKSRWRVCQCGGSEPIRYRP